MNGAPGACQCCLRLATYNVHRCVGIDGRCDPGRIVRVIEELDVDLIGIQEVDSGHAAGDCSPPLDYLTAGTDFNAVPGFTLEIERSSYGNALLTKHKVLEARRVNLSVPGREPRGAIDVDLEINGGVVRVIVTHLGLSYRERDSQLRRLRDLAKSRGERLQILMGDFNEWSPLSHQVRPLQEYFGRVPARPTFPSRLPVFALDRIWVRPRKYLVNVTVHATRTSRVASDHLPLKSEILLPASF